MFQYGPWGCHAALSRHKAAHKGTRTLVSGLVSRKGRKSAPDYWPLSTLCRAAYKHSISIASVAPANAVMSAWS